MPNPFLNSAMHTAESAALSKRPPATDGAAAPIEACSSLIPSPLPGLSGAPAQESPLVNSVDPQDLIDEIFIGAARLLPRELPADFQERLLAAIESDVWSDPAPLFLQGER